MLKVFRTWLLALMLAAFISPLAAQELPLVSDLQKDGQESQARGLPIMVFFMSNSCPYCEEVRKLYLEPMYRDGEYRNKIIMRVINIDSGDYMRDFNGRRTDHISFADSQGANFTPVIKFVAMNWCRKCWATARRIFTRPISRDQSEVPLTS
jgi:thioredoxin-related protein